MAAEGFTQGSVTIGDVAGLSDALAALDAADDALLAELADLEEQIEGIEGGSGTPVAIVVGRVSSGNITPQDTSGAVQLLTGGPTFSIAAAAGDRIEAEAGYLTARNDSTYYDLVVIVSGAAVRYATTGSSTPSTEGDPGMYPQVPTYQGRPGPFTFTAEAGDISGGTVTFGFVVKSGGVGTLFANTAFPLRYTLKNFGQAS